MSSMMHSLFNHRSRKPGRVSLAGRVGILAAFGLLLASCAVPEGESVQSPRLPTDAEVEQYNAAVDPEERIVCRDEVSVGTNIPQRKCRYVRDIEATSTLHREQLRDALR